MYIFTTVAMNAKRSLWNPVVTSGPSLEKVRLQALLNKATRWGLNVRPAPQLQDIIKYADTKLFDRILSCAGHVLHSFLPPVKPTSQRLRRRAHDRILPIKTTSTERNFFIRMLYS